MLEKNRTVGVNEKPVVCITFIREAKTHGEALTHTNESRKSEFFSRDFYTFSKIFTFWGSTRATPNRGKKCRNPTFLFDLFQVSTKPELGHLE